MVDNAPTLVIVPPKSSASAAGKEQFQPSGVATMAPHRAARAIMSGLTIVLELVQARRNKRRRASKQPMHPAAKEAISLKGWALHWRGRTESLGPPRNRGCASGPKWCA